MPGKEPESEPTLQEGRSQIQARYSAYTLWYVHTMMDLNRAGHRYSLREKRVYLEFAKTFKDRAKALQEALDIIDGKQLPPIKLPKIVQGPIEPI